MLCAFSLKFSIQSPFKNDTKVISFVRTLINWGVANLTVATKQTFSSYEGRCDLWIVPSKPLCAELGTEGRQRRRQHRRQCKYGGKWQQYHKTSGPIFICGLLVTSHALRKMLRIYIYTSRNSNTVIRVVTE